MPIVLMFAIVLFHNRPRAFPKLEGSVEPTRGPPNVWIELKLSSVFHCHMVAALTDATEG